MSQVLTTSPLVGKIIQLYPTKDGCDVMLKEDKTKYLKLSMGQANYSSIYSLLLVAAIQQKPVTFNITSSKTIDSIHVDF